MLVPILTVLACLAWVIAIGALYLWRGAIDELTRASKAHAQELDRLSYTCSLLEDGYKRIQGRAHAVLAREMATAVDKVALAYQDKLKFHVLDRDDGRDGYDLAQVQLTTFVPGKIVLNRYYPKEYYDLARREAIEVLSRELGAVFAEVLLDNLHEVREYVTRES